jgi:replicative DNA helicase
MPDLQVPPSSREAEEAVLGCILMEGLPIYERVAGWIREDDAFYFKDNQRTSQV